MKETYEVFLSDGFQEAIKILSLRLAKFLIPLSEVVLAAFLGYCGYRLTQGKNLKRHSVLQSKRISDKREPPRDMLKTHFFQNRQGLWINHVLWWNKPNKTPKGIIVFLHGHSEHSKRYHHVADYVNNHDYAMFAMDHQGFGRSEGDRCHVELFEDYVEDVTEFLEKVVYNDHLEWKVIPRFIMGHSMGGLIALHTAFKCQNSTKPALKLNGAILSSPALNLDPSRDTWYLRLIGGIIDKVFPKAPLVSFPRHIATSFRQVQDHGTQDPLNYHGNVRVHQGLELIKGTKMAFEYAPNFKTPLFIIHGHLDLHAGIQGSQKFFSAVAIQDKEMLELDNIYHQPLHEERPIREEVFAKICTWLDAHLK